MFACALIDLHTSRLLLLTLYLFIAIISVLIYITVFYALFIPVNVACDVHEFGIDVRVFAFISTGFWMCLLYHNIKQTKLWAVLVCNIKVIDDGEEVISIGVPTGGASLPEITRTSTTADGTCNEETTW